MAQFKQPEILPPTGPAPRAIAPRDGDGRTVRGRALFSNENLDLLAHVLDDWFCVPGTSLRFGLDGILGFIPGLGDLLAGLASCILIVAAWFRGAPYITLVRMIANVALEVAVGAVPFLGDAFVIFWKANRRNYALLVRHIDQPHRPTWGDWMFLGVLAVALLAVFLAPLVVLVALLWWVRPR